MLPEKRIERMLHQKITFKEFMSYFSGSTEKSLCSQYSSLCQLESQSMICEIFKDMLPLDPVYVRTMVEKYVKEICMEGTVELDVSLINILEQSKSIARPDWKGQNIFLNQENSESITIKLSSNLLCKGTTGLSLWDASYAFASFLLATATATATTSADDDDVDDYYSKNNDRIKGKTVLELGCGVGFISILCGKHLGAKRVFATDLNLDVLKVAQDNIQSNSSCKALLGDIISTHQLDLSDLKDLDFLTGIETIIVCDMVFDPVLANLLVASFDEFFTKFPALSQILVCSTVRNEKTFYEGFLDKITDKFNIRQIPLKDPTSNGLFHIQPYSVFNLIEITTKLKSVK